MQQASAKKPSVLIVDDEEDMRFVLGNLLNKWGYQAITACGAQEGLDILEKSIPIAVLSDIELPRISGLELLQIIKQKYPGIPVIMMSGGTATEENAERSLRLGAFDFIPKPFDPKSLKKMLSAIQSSVSSNRKQLIDTTASHGPQ